MPDPRVKLVCDDAVLLDHDFSGANLEGVICMDARFDGSSFRKADLYWAIATGASFAGWDFSFADLRGANLKDTHFGGARLIQTNFGRDNLGGATQLQGADLSTAEIRSSVFDGAEYDSRTKFPKGFYPDKHGLRFNEQP
jgi:uncharacterized protein YjbI with pentapeptide repeats